MEGGRHKLEELWAGGRHKLEELWVEGGRHKLEELWAGGRHKLKSYNERVTEKDDLQLLTFCLTLALRATEEKERIEKFQLTDWEHIQQLLY